MTPAAAGLFEATADATCVGEAIAGVQTGTAAVISCTAAFAQALAWGTELGLAIFQQ